MGRTTMRSASVSMAVAITLVVTAAGCEGLLGTFALAPETDGGGDAGDSGDRETSAGSGPEAGLDAATDGSADAPVDARAPVDAPAVDTSADARPDATPADAAGGDAGREAATSDGPSGDGDATLVSTDAAVDAEAGPCSTDLTIDPGNCGRCGHACGPPGQLGQCVASVCQPIAIVSPTYYPVALAVDATSVYWIETQDASQVLANGSVKKAPLAGGGSYTILAAQQPDPIAIAVSPAGVFWLNAGAQGPGGLMYMAPGATAPTPVATGFTVPTGGVVVTASNVFWFDETMTAPQGENLLGLPLTDLTAASVPTKDTAVAACVYAPPVLVGSSLFWLQSGCFANSGSLMGIALPVTAGATPTALLPTGTFLNGPYSAARVAVDANTMYFGANNSSQVASIETEPLAGGNLSVVFSASPNGVATDGVNVYWTDNQALSVLSRPIAGGPTTTLASGQTNPWDIAVDSTSVYWTNDSSPGSVMKVAKP